MNIRSPHPNAPHKLRRLIGTLIFGIGGLILLNRFMVEVDALPTAERGDELQQIQDHTPAPRSISRTVEA